MPRFDEVSNMIMFLLLLLALVQAAPRILPQSRTDPAFTHPSSGDHRPLVLLVTQFRSGSTFLGELFNQNPDIFYEFEGLHNLIVDDSKTKNQLHGVSSRHTADEEKMLLLSQIQRNCSVPINCFREVLHRFWQCGQSEEENMKLLGQAECDESLKRGVNIQDVRRYHCLTRRQGAVIKVIRLRRLRDLQMLDKAALQNIKVVHLIRDPRAMLRSRSGFKDIFTVGKYQMDWTRVESTEKLSLEMESDCARYRDDQKWGRKLLGDNRYISVTHDELSLHPITTAYKIYRFLGLDLPQTVLEFLKSNTEGKDQMEKREGSMNTKRDSEEVIEKWLKEYVGQRVPLVERECGGIVRRFWDFKMDPRVEYGFGVGWSNQR
eukprot:sb/3465721/